MIGISCAHVDAATAELPARNADATMATAPMAV
jgi:hypothetical protein